MSIPLSKKLHLSREGVYKHYCPGCKGYHLFYVGVPASTGAMWHYDGNHESPTFSPSMHISYGSYVDAEHPEENIPRTTSCHYILTNGVIHFCSDCEHALRGKQVPLPDIPQH